MLPVIFGIFFVFIPKKKNYGLGGIRPSVRIISHNRTEIGSFFPFFCDFLSPIASLLLFFKIFELLFMNFFSKNFLFYDKFRAFLLL